jgi:hypothetical protein
MSGYEIIVIGYGKNWYATRELAKERLKWFNDNGYVAYLFKAGKIPDEYKGHQLHLYKYKEIGDAISLSEHKKILGTATTGEF